MRSNLPIVPLPSVQTLAKVFGIGATVGPIVDSLHNQCLLQYDYAPIVIPFPLSLANNPLGAAISTATAHDNLLCSSWIVPPLLGIAYVILGVIMPRLVGQLLGIAASQAPNLPTTSSSQENRVTLQRKAIIAVATTALLILSSAILETSFQEEYWNQQQDLSSINDMFQSMEMLNAKRMEQGILTLLAILQWAWLDTSRSSLWIGILAYFGGPLCELPFCGHDLWHYLPEASDFFPLASFPLTDGNEAVVSFLAWIMGSDNFQALSLSSITGPCYFAVTTDAIAVARWLESTESSVPTDVAATS